jgi:hypothetical protein
VRPGSAGRRAGAADATPGGHRGLHLHFHGLPDAGAAAAIIRQAITGPAAEPVTVPASDGVPGQNPALPA